MVAPLIAAARAAASTAAKQAAKSAAKSASKSIAQASRNARKMGARKISNLEKELKNTKNKNVRAFIKQDINSIQKAINKTYQRLDGKKTGNTIQDIKANINFLRNNSTSRTMFGGENRLQNYMTQKQLNLATKVQDYLDAMANPSKYTSNEVKAFYRATQDIWQGKSGNRNKAIMDFFDVDSLSEAVEKVLKSPNVKNAMEIEKGTPESKLTAEQKKFYKNMLKGDKDQQAERSPDFLAYVVKFDVNEVWEKGERVQ